ncbi:SufD family Fe-S cluster assembly protein [Candidatus Woesearchaeota archaeon]|nr:SufD family Fe-S cluster assembly protein [Candidatus Woesearchaeota archaeon]
MITPDKALEHSRKLHESREQQVLRVESADNLPRLALPKLQEGLSIKLRPDMPDEIINPHYDDDERHLVKHDQHSAVSLFSQASTAGREAITKHRYTLIDPAKDRLAALQRAANEEGLLIIIPPHTVVDEPIEVASSYDANSFTHTLILAGEGSKATVTRRVTEEKTQAGRGLAAEAVEVVLQEGATLRLNESYRTDEETTRYGQRAAKLGRGAKLEWYTHLEGGALTITDTSTTLRGAESSCTTLTTTSTRGDAQADVRTSTYHETARTTSDMRLKSVCQDRGKLLHKGLVDIYEDADGAEGYQQADIITAGDAAADAIPQLEIDNPDVSCSHGGTVGQLDDEQLFYLRSRGLDEEEARKVLTRGFLLSITKGLDETWQAQIAELQSAGEDEEEDEEEELDDHELRREFLDEAKHPQNEGVLKGANLELHDHNPLCGEKLTIQMKLDDEQRVEDIRFSGTRCAINTATASKVTSYVKGKHVKEILRLTNDDMLKLLDIPANRLCTKCSFMPVRTIEQGLVSWTYKHKQEEEE